MIMKENCSVFLFFVYVVFIFIYPSALATDVSFSYNFDRSKRFVSLEESLDQRSKRDAENGPLSVTTTTEPGLRLVNESEWKNVTENHDIDHVYYLETFHPPTDELFEKHWIDIPKLLQNKSVTGKTTHPQLSNSYRRAVSTKLSFKFPFYGYLTENVTIATGGFCYVGQHMHSWLAATQYIAPLMANFDTTGPNSNILFADTGDLFVVEWKNVVLRHQQAAGNYSFQAILKKNGDIVYVYKNIPTHVPSISDAHHPRKVGLSDAYLYQHHVSSEIYSTLSKRVIYEYHRVEIEPEKLESRAVIIIKAQPVCIGIASCEQCTNSTLKNFNCSWCSVKEGDSFCSDEDGLHRRRQDWLLGNCKTQAKSVYCSAETEESSTTSSEKGKTGPSEEGNPSSTTVRPPAVSYGTQSSLPGASTDSTVVLTKSPERTVDHQTVDKTVTVEKADTSSGSGGIVALLCIVVLVFAMVGWIAYGYYNPHTTSGQLLIRYRPTRWRWPNSDVRYTASVHM